VADGAGVTLIGVAPEGKVVGVGFFDCFGFFASRLLRI
jgi:hypothetical protein